MRWRACGVVAGVLGSLSLRREDAPVVGSARGTDLAKALAKADASFPSGDRFAPFGAPQLTIA